MEWWEKPQDHPLSNLLTLGFYEGMMTSCLETPSPTPFFLSSDVILGQEGLIAPRVPIQL